MGDCSSSLALVDTGYNVAMGIFLITSHAHPMPVCGMLLIVFSLMPGWPHAVHEWLEGRRGRVFLSLCGCAPLIPREGCAAAPEFEYSAAVLGCLPKMSCYLAAELNGHDLLFGSNATRFGDWMILVAIFLNGAALAPAATRLVHAWKDAEAHDDTHSPRETLKDDTDTFTYMLHASDMLALVGTVGCVGVVWGPARFAQWLLALWLVCGLWPTIGAPPPMPTLRPAVPASGWKWFAHRTVSSLLLVSTVPPLSYSEALPLNERWVWPFAALLRVALIVTTVPLASVHGRYAFNFQSFAITESMDFVIVLATLFTAIVTCSRAIRLLYQQSEELKLLEEESDQEKPPRSLGRNMYHKIREGYGATDGA